MDTAQKIICDLVGLGMSDSMIAGEVDSTQPTIWRIRAGKTKSCRSDLYQALSELRKKEQVKRGRRRTGQAKSQINHAGAK